MKSQALRTGIAVTAVSFLIWECGASVVMACPMCKAALEEDPAKPLAFQTSILFMLTMIMVAVGSVTLLLTIVNRREMQSLAGSQLASTASPSA